MCGAHWGTYLYKDKQCRVNLFITSNLIALTCWFCVLTEHVMAMLISQLIAFASLLLLDFWLTNKQVITSAYFKTRFNVSTIVMAALMLTLLNLPEVQYV